MSMSDSERKGVPFRLDGQTAIVTGGARGIGAAVARRFASLGANVVVWDVIDAPGELGYNRPADIGSWRFRNVDVTCDQQVTDAVIDILDDSSRIDILINNAGVIRDRSFLKMSDEEWTTVIDVNLNSLFRVTRAVLPTMKEAGYGRIVSASSINGFTGAFGQTNYAATKAAVGGFTRALAREVGRYGITVNAVAPGFIETHMTASMPDEVIIAAKAQIPVGRIGTPDDMANAYLFLASREASFISGATLHANGGAYG